MACSPRFLAIAAGYLADRVLCGHDALGHLRGVLLLQALLLDVRVVHALLVNDVLIFDINFATTTMNLIDDIAATDSRD